MDGTDVAELRIRVSYIDTWEGRERLEKSISILKAAGCEPVKGEAFDSPLESQYPSIRDDESGIGYHGLGAIAVFADMKATSEDRKRAISEREREIIEIEAARILADERLRERGFGY